MARILSIDYGAKRCGLAVTDPLQIIVNGLDSMTQAELFTFVVNYCGNNEVEKIVLGYPLYADGSKNKLSEEIDSLKLKLEHILPEIKIVLYDEKKSSKEALGIMVMSGMSKKKRSDKALLDKMSAVIILQRYLGHI